jgi:four helix bundle protein
MSIAHKEARESAYWMRLIKEAKLISARLINDISDETEQLIKILSSILITAKQRK